MTMDNEIIFNDFVKSRNLAQETINSYEQALKLYMDFTDMSLKELLDEAENEEDKGVRWKRRGLKRKLLEFRSYLYDRYATSTANTHFGKVLTFYKHHEIEIHELPKWSNKNSNDAPPIHFKDLPDHDVIRKALNISFPIMRAIILFMSSSGCARRETLNLTVGDFVDATREYHDKDNIYDAMEVLRTMDDVVPTFKLKRQKTNKYYNTFCSPEATVEIINYLSIRKKELVNEDPLFKISAIYLMENFVNINNTLNLGKRGTYNRFRSHMLRKFHASQLYNDGVPLEVVDSLQGRGKDSTHSSYFMENPEKLKKIYVDHLNCLTINMGFVNVDFKSDKYLELEEKYNKKSKEINLINEKINALEKNYKDIGDFKEKFGKIMK